jgi:hypothetical protein
MRDADILRLGAIDLVAQNPAPGRAMRKHRPPAILAFAAGGDTRDQHPVARLECRHGPANLLNDADTLVAENAPRLASRDITLEDVQVGTLLRISLIDARRLEQQDRSMRLTQTCTYFTPRRITVR